MRSPFFLLLFLLVAPFANAATEGVFDQPIITPPPRPIPRLRPILTTGAIIEIYEEGAFQGIVLIKRGKSPFGIALPGGKVEWGETVEQAVQREMLEKTHLELSELRQFHVYSHPQRDARHHSIEVTFLAKSFSMPAPGDDAKEAFIVSLDEIPWKELVFDHAEILQDYLAYRYGKLKGGILLP